MSENIIPSSLAYLNRYRAGWINRISRRGLLKILAKIELGEILLEDGAEKNRFGQATDDFPLAAVVSVHDPHFYRTVLTGGNIGAGESYMAGFWSTNDLTRVIRIILRNQMVMTKMDTGWSRITAPLNKLFHMLRRNDRRGSRKNIMAHYDLGNDFYGLFLDDTWTYSSGIFESSTSSLEEASIAKYDRICRKLNLKAQDHVLEIGTGWGGFAIHAAANYGWV